MIIAIHFHKTTWNNVFKKFRFKEIFFYIIPPIIVTIICNQLLHDIPQDKIKDILSTTAGIVGTIVAIVFSMMLSTIERISSKYSPRFLHYILTNRIYIATILYSATLIILCLFFAPISSHLFLYIISFFFTIFLELFIVSLQETIHLMDPKYSILDPEVKNINKWLQKIISQEETKQLKYYLDKKAYIIPSEIEKNLEEKLLPIRDIIIKAIINNNLQEATNGITAFTKIALFYLKCRKNFISNDDPFIYFIYSEFQNIASSALENNHFHYRIHPLLIESLEMISKESLNIQIQPLGLTSNNNLVMLLAKEIKILYVQNLNFYNSSAPSQACKALEEIALKSIEKGYIQNTSSIISDLADMSKFALDSNLDLSFLSRRANLAIMKITSTLCNHREVLHKKQNINIQLQIIIDEYIKSIIIKEVKTRKINFNLIEPLSPFMCELYELSDDFCRFNLATLTSILIFTTNQPLLVNTGLFIIRDSLYFRILEPLSNILPTNEHNGIVKKFIDTMYLSQLYLLSIFNPELRKTFQLNFSKNLNLKLNKTEAMNTFEQGLNIIWEYFRRNERHEFNSTHTLDALFSLLIICLTDNNTDHELVKVAKKYILKIYNAYRSEKYSPEDTFFKYCRALNKFAKNTKTVKTNILTNIPKYTTKIENLFYTNYRADNSLPANEFGNFSASTGYNDQQWGLLGSNIFYSKYFNNLNNAIWKTSSS